MKGDTFVYIAHYFNLNQHLLHDQLSQMIMIFCVEDFVFQILTVCFQLDITE